MGLKASVLYCIRKLALERLLDKNYEFVIRSSILLRINHPENKL